jgi:hypothetical protein
MITIQQLPLADAGADGSVCHDEGYPLSGSAENSEGVTWTTSGDGTFNDPSSATAIYYPGDADINSGEVELTLTANPSAPCTVEATDALTLVINHCQEISIPAGWSGISSWIEPQDSDLDTIFDKVMNDLVILQSQTGVFWPGQNVNTIGAWNTLEGYSIKMDAITDLTLAGSRSATTVLNLGNGWTMMPVLSECLVNAEDLFSGQDVTIVKEIAGWKVYWPALGINNLESLEPGKAYYALLNSGGSINFPDCTPESLSEPDASQKSIFETIGDMPWNTFSTSPHTHTIGLPVAAVGETVLKQGDLIGAFDNEGNCFGVAEWNGENTSITLFGDDPLKDIKDGFAEGDQLFFRVFIRSTAGEYELLVVYDDNLPNSDGRYHNNGLSLIGDLKIGATGISEGNAKDALIYPNPASDVLYIDFDRPGQVNAIIYDVSGHVMVDRDLNELRNQLDISGLRSGVYLIKLEGSELLKIERIIKK